jgi:hypothetical protein
MRCWCWSAAAGSSMQNCEDELKPAGRPHGLEDSRDFTGSVDNVHEYLQASDLFVFPSEREAFGISDHRGDGLRPAGRHHGRGRHPRRRPAGRRCWSSRRDDEARWRRRSCACWTAARRFIEMGEAARQRAVERVFRRARGRGLSRAAGRAGARHEPGTWDWAASLAGAQRAPRPIATDLTLVIPTLGRPILAECLGAVLEGSMWPGAVIVVDQGGVERDRRLAR